MKRIKLLFICLSFVFAQSCNEKQEPYVSISAVKDTVKVNERYLAEIYLENFSDSSNIPLFYIISNRNDTALLPYNEEKGCAVFSASGSKLGEIEWRGFVKYTDKNNNPILSFEKTFYIKAE